MKSTITNAADITVLGVIDNTYKTGGGSVSLAGTVVIASKGPVGSVVKITGDEWSDIFGTPLPKKSTGMEGLRHLADAAEACDAVNVVRVVADDAKYPYITFSHSNERGIWESDVDYNVGDIVTTYPEGDSVSVCKIRCVKSHRSAEDDEPTCDEPGIEWEPYEGLDINDAEWDPAGDESYVTYAASSYGEALPALGGAMMIVKPKDGDPSVNRSICFENIDTENERFDIVFYDKDSLGQTYKLESLTVSPNVDAVDDMGVTAYVESVFEIYSEYFECDWNEDAGFDSVLATITGLSKFGFSFTGGTNGGEPTTENWKSAWKLLKNEQVETTMLFAAGNYDSTVLQEIADIADFKHCASFADVPGYLPESSALEWVTAAGIKSRHMRMYYSPYSATDEWRGGKTVWGVSGAAAAAKANGNANYSGATPGVHYAPAGPKRATLSRTGIKTLFPEQIIDRDDFYDARINPVVANSSGGASIDDDLTLHYQQNYSRFGWVNDILDYIDHRFVEAASYAKFEPDGLTYEILTDLVTEILDSLVTSGALVTPREPDRDGTSPYVLTIKQLEIDLWHVQWDICPSGAARRIAGQPVLVK